MTSYRHSVTFQAASGIPRDAFVNVWYSKDPASYGSLPGVISNFYIVRPTGSVNSVMNYYSPEVARGANTLKIETYALPATLIGPAGPPIDVQTFTTPAASGSSWLPATVSAALSIHGLYGGVPEHAPGARPRARLRGRLYLGPLTMDAITESVSGDRQALLSSTFMADCINAYKVAQGAAANVFAVHSKKDQQLYPVVGGWMDNRPDSTRRRAPDATGRTTFSIP